ncbi:choice-of-anchor A family protein [Mobilitalea sibirica]|uniref:Choice-of-anchor A family protein n=1 Tax=Mobilitalea sibirica TaxID=1462919 RepID=A0A8J7H1U0_9FIRM|nr:collagen-binding domain-containing protein [Mobilitalea sibirica]MBH1940487.1 choice-of-anchor A family protein [Mobilitalea sibirica]
MYNNINGEAYSYAGVPYEDINWYDVVGQPFGIASYFNAIIFEDANNIVDTKGAMAVGGNFVSPRGLSLAYGNEGNLVGTGYSPDFVRFLVGKDIAMQGPLVVIGHVVAGGDFRAAGGSTYMIGKDGTQDQIQELMSLYQANGGSQYWRPSDRGSHYAISSYDIPRYIPASRIGADVQGFFRDARESIEDYHECITGLEPTGTVTEHYHEWILRGDDPVQNVFLIDVRPNGILDKEIRFEIPEGSLGIVIFRTGSRAHLQYGLWGEERLANRTLYVFEDADNIHMEVPAAIWGSILAPQAMFHAHPTGGTVSGNAALRSFAVNARSGFEFHLYPFEGGVECGEVSPTPPEIPEEVPAPIPAPEPEPCPPCPPCPEPQPCPPCPEQQPCPPCPEPRPCPPCPEPEPCPPCPPCPEPQPCPPCPEPRPCPPCPEQETRVEYVPYPIRVPIPYPKTRTRIEYRILPVPLPCPKEEPCPECLIKPGIIFGCIWGCGCCGSHDYEVKLYKIFNEKKTLMYCEVVTCCGCFEFEADYEGCYLLKVCPIGCSKKGTDCKPIMTLKNIGVSSLMVEA